MTTLVPSLSISGWHSTVPQKADAIVAYYMASEHSQTDVYRDALISLAYDIQQNNQSPNALEKAIKTNLHNCLDRYFDLVEVTVNVTELEKDSNSLDIIVDVVVGEGGVKYSLGREIRAINDKVQSIININLEGE